MIAGLTYIQNALSDEEAKRLLNHIDTELWRHDLKRRVQHYGYIYDYKRRNVTPDLYIGVLPTWSDMLVNQLEQNEVFGFRADQIIVNEYQPGQGIAHHIDCEPCFGDVIASLSLNSTCVMNFIHAETNETHDLLLEPNSLLIMCDEARYDWKHGIVARKSDVIGGERIKRDRRVSVTLRKVILAEGGK